MDVISIHRQRGFIDLSSSASKMTQKGQVTIPAKLRKRLKLEPGSKLRLFVEPDEHSVVMTATGSIKDAFGILPKPKRVSTIEEMDEAVQSAVAKHVMDI